jgi:hypothetical protein
MKITAPLLALCVTASIEGAAADPLSCTGVTPCPTMQNIFGKCGSYLADEIVCRTENKSLASPVHSSRTSFGYYPPPAGYSLVPETAHAVFKGRGIHGVSASVTSKQLFCLWGTAGGGYTAGYCEVRAQLIKST